MTIFLIGMCYAGKTTIGKLLSEKLNKNWLDSRDIFKSLVGVSENEYLSKHGKMEFQKVEEASICQDFGDSIISLGGSAIYYSKQMQHLKDDPSHTIIWLNVPFDVIVQRKAAENWERPIVFPDGISSFYDLYCERRKLYEKFHTVEIKISSSDSPNDIVSAIINKLYT